MAKTKIELSPTVVDAITTVESLLVDAKAATATKSAVDARITALDEDRKNKLRAAMPDELRRKLNGIELQAKKAREAIEAERVEAEQAVTDLRTKMETLVVDVIKASVKHDDAGSASYVKGRDQADFAGLRALIHDHPAIKPLLSTGDPSMRLKLKK